MSNIESGYTVYVYNSIHTFSPSISQPPPSPHASHTLHPQIYDKYSTGFDITGSIVVVDGG
ncbi:MAG: hypothetical protein F6K23_13130 [Okeania sp. SIO2C9]|uniref:hypothetical protein n=1 Tax=Okeania sp. SIO2C9 TaxID=2607791 RepID=UPI0013C0D6A8|nr:hypothetical protein [Okeania sp. SIO2C9]NEQ73912.1 hypothetical protein [Okeania sp. SIO2C9]